MTHAGIDEALIIETMVRQNKPIPKDLANAPVLAQGLGLFLRAFMQTNSCRISGMKEGPIPWTAILAWCNENEVLGRQRSLVFNHVRAMDNAYLTHRAVKVT